MAYMRNYLNFKRILTIFFILFSFLLASCSGSENNNTSSMKNEDNLESSSIVIYFSQTNHTKQIASYIIELTNSISYQILPKIPYTDEDIKYYTDCRADREQKDPRVRVEIGSAPIDISTYDIIYLGYPIWHGDAPKIMYTFVESYNFENKTIIPFCTSESSPVGNSSKNLESLTDGVNWLLGKRFSITSSKEEVEIWLNTLKQGE